MASQDIHPETHNLDNRIRMLAYELWEEAGRPDGRDQEFWERAEQVISGEAKPDAVPQAQLDALTT